MTKVLVDKAVIEQALDALETLNSGDSYKTHNAAAALREQLAKQPEQKPVGMVIGGVFEPWNDDILSGTWELYAAPVRVQDLTDDEIRFWIGRFPFLLNEESEKWVIGLARAVIAADREKNK